MAALAGAGCTGLPASAMPGVLGDRDALAADYRAWLDRGRTPARAVAMVVARSPGFTVIDLVDGDPASIPERVRPGDRLVFVHRGRTAVVVRVGEHPLRDAGARMIVAHIDTPLPRVSLAALDARGQGAIRAHSYGGMRSRHWLHRPLALVGRVARAGGDEIEISLGLDDDFALYASSASNKGVLAVTTGSMPAKVEPELTLMGELHRRHGLTATDLQAAELYLVPRARAREVGLDRELIGAHGQDDRANSYLAWRAVIDLHRVPRNTAMAWLVDREETGSAHPAGAQSRVLEMVFAYLLRARGGAATETELARAFAATRAISADTPPALNPNWPEVLEPMHAPVLGGGPALFPYTGRGGKSGGSQAHPALIRDVVASFERTGVAVQYGELGRVDEGGGGSVARHLGERGIDVVDLGVPVVGMHSPLELTAKDDLWAMYRGLGAWLRE